MIKQEDVVQPSRPRCPHHEDGELGKLSRKNKEQRFMMIDGLLSQGFLKTLSILQLYYFY
jgi:hypothetical protein